MGARQKHHKARQRNQIAMTMIPIRRGYFRLSSGFESDHFFDVKGALVDAQSKNHILQGLIVRLNLYLGDCVVGVGSGGALLALLIAERKPAVLTAFIYGRDFIRGADNIRKAKRIFVVEDVVTTGAQVKKVVETIKKDFDRKPEYVICVVKRGENVDVGAPLKYLNTGEQVLKTEASLQRLT